MVFSPPYNHNEIDQLLNSDPGTSGAPTCHWNPKLICLKAATHGARKEKNCRVFLRNKVGNKLVVWCQIVVDEKPPPYWRTKAQKQNVAGMLKVCEKVMTQMQPTIWQHSNPALGHRARHMARHVHIQSLFCTTHNGPDVLFGPSCPQMRHISGCGLVQQLNWNPIKITTLNSSNRNSETQYSLPQWASKQRKCLGHFRNKIPTARWIHSSRRGRIWSPNVGLVT